MVSGIYKIENLVNNKVYIGRSKNIKKRMWQHKHRTNERLSEDMKKHGLEKFHITMLEESSDLDDMKAKEDYYIGLYKSHLNENGYNTVYDGIEYPKEKPIVVSRVTLDIERDLWHEVGIQAAIEGTTRRKIVEDSLKEYMENNKDEN